MKKRRDGRGEKRTKKEGKLERKVKERREGRGKKRNKK